MKLLLTSLFSMAMIVNQPSTLQLIEEQVESVLMIHCPEYEKGSKVGEHFTDITISYMGNSTIDAKKDSSFYYVFGTYTFDKYTNVNNQIFGEFNGQSFTSSGSTSYLAKIKQVLDDFRVQEVIVIKDPAEFDFASFNFDELSKTSDMLFPEVIHRDVKDKKKDEEKEKDKKKNTDKD